MTFSKKDMLEKTAENRSDEEVEEDITPDLLVPESVPVPESAGQIFAPIPPPGLPNYLEPPQILGVGNRVFSFRFPPSQDQHNDPPWTSQPDVLSQNVYPGYAPSFHPYIPNQLPFNPHQIGPLNPFTLPTPAFPQTPPSQPDQRRQQSTHPRPPTPPVANPNQTDAVVERYFSLLFQAKAVDQSPLANPVPGSVRSVAKGAIKRFLRTVCGKACLAWACLVTTAKEGVWGQNVLVPSLPHNMQTIKTLLMNLLDDVPSEFAHGLRNELLSPMMVLSQC